MNKALQIVSTVVFVAICAVSVYAVDPVPTLSIQQMLQSSPKETAPQGATSIVTVRGGTVRRFSLHSTSRLVPVASDTVSGTIKVGTGLAMDANGKLNNTGISGVASFNARGGAVKPGFDDYSASMIKGLKPVAKTGSYSDLTNKPTIPAAQVSSDWNASSGVAQILNKPSIPTSLSQLSEDSTHRTVTDTEKTTWNSNSSPVSSVFGRTGAIVKQAGDYTAADVGADAIGSATSVQSNLDTHTNNVGNPHSVTKTQVGLGSVDNTSDANKPVSSATQTALDLKANSSALGTAAAKDIPATGNALTTQVVYGTDTRLSDARTPVTHDQAATTITSGTLDGDRLPAISTTKKGAVPATGTPSGKYLYDNGTWADLSPSFSSLIGTPTDNTALGDALAGKLDATGSGAGLTGLTPGQVGAEPADATIIKSGALSAATDNPATDVAASVAGVKAVQDAVDAQGVSPTAFMDGQSGRNTLAAWIADPTIDVTAAMQAALNSGKRVVLDNSKKYVISSADLTIPNYTALVGGYEHVSNSSKNFTTIGSALYLKNGKRIIMKNGAQLKGVLVLRGDITGLINNGDTDFVGTAIVSDHADNYIGYNAIIGFEYGIWNDGLQEGQPYNRPRATIENNIIDCKNGIVLADSGDTARIKGNHIWPFTSNVANGYAYHMRSGYGIRLSNVYDWAQLSDNIVYGHSVGVSLHNVNSVTSIRDGIDAPSFTEYSGARTTIGVEVTGTSTEVMLIAPQVASHDRAIVVNTSAGKTTLIEMPALWANATNNINILGGNTDISGGVIRGTTIEGALPNGIVVDNAASIVRYSGTRFISLLNETVQTAGVIDSVLSSEFKSRLVGGEGQVYLTGGDSSSDSAKLYLGNGADESASHIMYIGSSGTLKAVVGSKEGWRVSTAGTGIGTASIRANLHSVGTTIIGTGTSALADTLMDDNAGPQINPYLDAAGNKLKFKVIYDGAAGDTGRTVQTGEIPLGQTFDTAAFTPSTDYATAAQGARTDTTVYHLSDYADLQAAVDAATAAGGSTVLNAKGAIIEISTTFVPKNNVRVDLNGGTLKWIGAASGVMVENDITAYGAKHTGMFNGKLDPGANVATVFKFHSIRSGYYGDLKLVSGNITMTFLHVLADAAVADPQDGVSNAVYNVFGPFVSDAVTSGVPKVRYGIVLEGNSVGGFHAVTNNTFVGPMLWWVTDGVGYRFLKNSDTNEFTGFHHVVLTTNDANGTGMILNDTATPSVDADVWGIHFEYFGTATWYQVAGKKSVVINKAGSNKIDFLNNDAPAFWGNNLVVDNYSDSHDITVFNGSGVNTTEKLVKGDVTISGTGHGVTFPDLTQILGMTGDATNAASATGTPSNGCAQWLDGNLTSIGSDCGTSSSSMVYPAAGVAKSTGSAWDTSYTVGTGASNLVQLDGSSRLPAVNGSQLTSLPSQLTTSAVTVSPSDATALAPLTLTRTVPDLALGNAYSIVNTNTGVSAASPNASSTVRGYNMNPTYTGSGTLLNLVGFFSTPRLAGSSATAVITELSGYSTDMRNSNSAGGSITGLVHYNAPSPILSGPVGTIYGFKAGNQGNAQSATSYGFYIENQSGSTTSYSLRTGTSNGGASFGDFLSLRNLSAPGNVADNVRLYNVEGDYLHVKDEDGNDHTIGQGAVTSSVHISTVATGTQPWQTTSTTMNSNLNADLLDGQHGSYYARALANGTATLGTSAIASGACATAVTVAGTGIATTDVIDWGFNGDPTGVTGYVPSTSGMLTIITYPTADNVNFKVCNNTGNSITPGAITLNWRVQR